MVALSSRLYGPSVVSPIFKVCLYGTIFIQQKFVPLSRRHSTQGTKRGHPCPWGHIWFTVFMYSFEKTITGLQLNKLLVECFPFHQEIYVKGTE